MGSYALCPRAKSHELGFMKRQNNYDLIIIINKKKKLHQLNTGNTMT